MNMKKPPINIVTRCDHRLNGILQVIAAAIPAMPATELLKFMHMIVLPEQTPSKPGEIKADQVYALCAVAGYAVAQQTAAAIREKESEIKQNN